MVIVAMGCLGIGRPLLLGRCVPVPSRVGPGLVLGSREHGLLVGVGSIWRASFPIVWVRSCWVARGLTGEKEEVIKKKKNPVEVNTSLKISDNVIMLVQMP